MKVLRVGVLIWLVAAAAASSACDPSGSDIGVSVSDSGALRILHNPCKGSSLIHSAVLEDSGGRVLWRIESAGGSPLREFTVGEQPPGFETAVSLTSDLHGIRLRATISDIGPEYFDLSEIDVGKVLVVGEGNMTAEEFWARDTCERGWLN